MLEYRKNMFYNEDVKKQYLESINSTKGSIEVAMSNLSKAKEIEEQFGKDIYGFNDVEIKDLILNHGGTTVASIRAVVSQYKVYVDYCMANGLRGEYENGMNNFAIFQQTENLSDYVSNAKMFSKYLSEDEIMAFINELVNPVDQLAIALPYNFIIGNKLEEIRSIKLSDLDEETNILKVRDIDDNIIREQVLPNYLVQIMKEADMEDIYTVNNGEETATHITERKLAKSHYLMKPLARGDNSYTKVSQHYILNKFTSIKEYLTLSYEEVTPLTLRSSRIFNMVLDKMRARGEAIASFETFREVFDEVEEDFGYELSSMQEYSIRTNFIKYNALKK